MTDPGRGRPPRTPLRKVVKLARILAVPGYWRGLRRGVAAAVEHDALPLPSGIRTVLDVGAHKGQFALTATRRWPEAELVCFEPLDEPRAALTRVLAGRDRTRVVAAAVGEREGAADFHISRASDSSSLLPITPRQVALFPGTESARTQRVRITRLDAAVPGSTLIRPALLKIDVQGAELQVLRGAAELLDRIDVVLVECSFVELYAGQPHASEVVRLLDGHGFVLADIGRPTRDRTGRLVQTDLVFRRP